MRLLKLIAVIVCVGAVIAAACVARAGDWNVVRLQNHDYVSFANVAQFYRLPDFTQANRTVSLRDQHKSLRAQSGTSELYINGVRFFTDFPIISNADEELISVMDVSKIVEPVLRPNKIVNAQKVQTVVLDPGHGGNDQGTSNRWGTEKAYALDVALAARDQLLHSGYQVEMTRTNDARVELEERVQFANRFPNAVFVSIHFNSSSGGAGAESYALAPAGVVSNAANESHVSPGEVQPCEGNLQDSLNIALTAAIHATVLARTGAYDRGIRHARFHVLRNIKVPAALLEAGFLSDPREAARIATMEYRQRIGLAIAQGIQNYDNAVNFRGGAATFAAAKVNLPPHEHSITEPLQPYDGGSSEPEAPSASIRGGE
jgi:N-acetylmuramoyl-L-alanine amidase